MQMSLVPLVMTGQVDPLVGQVRRVLNVPGGDELDRPLMELLRGVQSRNGLDPHGELDERTLSVFGITAV